MSTTKLFNGHYMSKHYADYQIKKEYLEGLIEDWDYQVTPPKVITDMPMCPSPNGDPNFLHNLEQKAKLERELKRCNLCIDTLEAAFATMPLQMRNAWRAMFEFGKTIPQTSKHVGLSVVYMHNKLVPAMYQKIEDMYNQLKDLPEYQQNWV